MKVSLVRWSGVLLTSALFLSVTGCFHQQPPPAPEPQPTAQFTYTPTTPKPGEELVFDASASSAPPGRTLADYRWDFGDGTSASGVIVTHAYAQAGSYTVTLTVVDDQNAQATAQQTVTVAAPPSAEFLELPQEILDLQGLAWDGENFWALDGANLKLYKLSRASGHALAVFELPDAEYPTAVAWDAQNQRLFVLDGNSNSIYQINPGTGSVVHQVELAEGVPVGMTWGDGTLWVSDFDVPKIYKINPDSGRVLGAIAVGLPGAALGSIGWGDGALWVYDGNSDMIYKIDPTTGQKLAELRSAGMATVGLAWDGQNLWGADAQDLKIYKVTP